MVKIQETRMSRQSHLAEKKVDQTEVPVRPPRLVVARVLMILFGLFFFGAVSAKQTVFNANYVQQQIEKSSAAEVINQQLDTQLQQAGINQSNLIPDDLVNDELKTMVQQFYDGQQVHIDENIITNAINQSTQATGAFQQTVNAMVVSKVVAVFNSQLDTQKLSRYAGQVQKLSRIDQTVIWVSGVGLVLTLAYALLRKRLFSTISSTLLVVGGFVAIICGIGYVSNVLSNLPIQYPVVKQIVQTAGQDLLVREFTIALGLFLVGVVLAVFGKGFTTIRKGLKRR